MAETMSLKALADAVLRRDTTRDDLETGVSHGRETRNEAVRRGEMAVRHDYQNLTDDDCVRIYSRLLDAELWIVADEEAAEELRREGVTLPILLPDEAMILGKMAQADAGEVFGALARIQCVMPGSRLRSVERIGSDA